MTPARADQDRPDRTVASQADGLDAELLAFAQYRAGPLDDVGLIRLQVAQALDSARTQQVPCRDLEIIERVTEGGLRLRIYRPRRLTDAPALVYCHGGAFLLGSPELEDPGCVRYALGADCVVVSVDYRLAPEHRFPAGVEDCYAALAWAVRNHADLGIDVDRVAIGGSSAGGALAAAVALMARDRGGPKLGFQMLIYPVLDDRLTTPSMIGFTDTPVFARPTAEAMWRHYLGPGPAPVSPYAAPARSTDLAGLPPAYVEACALDPLRDENIAYATRLMQAGVPAELHVIPGVPHGFDQFYLGAPGAMVWPVPAPPSHDHDDAAPPRSAMHVETDLARMPQVTRRVLASRIGALRAAFWPAPQQSNGSMSDRGRE